MLKHAELFAAGLRIFNFNLTLEYIDGKAKVTLPFDDKDKVVCLFDGDDGRVFTAFAIVDGVPADKSKQAFAFCNELNTKYMWAKFLVGPGQNGNKGIHIGIDAILTEADTAAQAIELLLKFIDVCKTEISNIRSFIDKLTASSTPQARNNTDFRYATPQDDPGFADACWYDINKHPAEMRTAKNGEVYIAL